MDFNETSTSSLPTVSSISTATDASSYESSEVTANNSRPYSEFANISNTPGHNVSDDSTPVGTYAGTMSTTYDVSDSSISNDSRDSRISTTVSSSASFHANDSTMVITTPTTDISVGTSTSTFTNVSTSTGISANTNIDTSPNTSTSVSNNPSTSTSTFANVSTRTGINTNINIDTSPNTNNTVSNNPSTSTTVETTTDVSTNMSISTNTNINTKPNTYTSVSNSPSTSTVVKTTTNVVSTSVSSDTSLSISTSGSFSSSNDTSTNSVVGSRPSTRTKVSTSFTVDDGVSATASSRLISSAKVDVSTDTSFIHSTTSSQIRQTNATEGHSTSQTRSSTTNTSRSTTNTSRSTTNTSRSTTSDIGGSSSYHLSSIATTASTVVTTSVSEGLPTTVSATNSIITSPGGWIAAPIVCGALLLAAVVTIVILVKLRRMPKCKRRRCFEKSNDGPYVSPLTTLPTNEYTRPALITDFINHVANLRRDSDFGFACAFEMLKEQSIQFPKSAAELPENRPKNRYTNILPFDKDRVKLTPMEDDMTGGSDYINASFLPGVLSRREYIATQGPIPGTMDDFWRMIWEYNVTTIVMVTDLVEEGKVLTSQYWPNENEQPVRYGDVRVELKSEAVVGNYILRIFSVSLDEKSRQLKQFHLTNWKDRSSFNDVEKFLAFHGDVKRSLTNSPLLVHCSAGVGRTGTFIAVDHLLQKMERDSNIDVFNLILEMRSHRVNMVQTLTQYSFVHDCISYVIEHNYHKGIRIPSGNSFRDSNEGGNSEEALMPLSTFRSNITEA